MLNLSIPQILDKIKKNETFEAVSEDHSFQIKIEEYVPYICTAIHDGHQLREELKNKILLTEHERWQEEDPHTADFISSLPIVITALDSRYEYDLNRTPQTAIYEYAWGKQVWERPLSDIEKKIGLQKHENFYLVIDSLVEILQKEYKECIVYDIHSYNYKRYDREVPLFNIGTENIDTQKYRPIIDKFVLELSKIELPNVVNTTKINDAFYGRGYLLRHITKKFKNTLVLATEVKKEYCNEESGEVYSLVIDALKEGFKTAILNLALDFTKKHTNLNIKKKSSLLSSELANNVIKVDKMLYKLVRNFEVLNYVNPVNLEKQKKRFFSSKYMTAPKFKYKQLALNPFELKRKLNNLPVEQINDVNIENLYVEVINAYTDKIEMLANIDSPKFLYNSLRYFGEPSHKDVENANFLLYCNSYEADEEELFSTDQAVNVFKKTIDDYGINCKIVVSDKTVSKALVLNSKKTVVLKRGALFSERQLNALAHHEIGVHMVTTINSGLQPLKIFNLGLPVNTKTQEGLAILSEYYSGNLTLKRLKELALRVIAIHSMLEENNFVKTFSLLKDQHGMTDNEAFYLTTRVYRGGGFTKDYLYLRGFSEVLEFVKSGKPFNNLLIGKTSMDHLDTINEMIERKLLNPPKYITSTYLDQKNGNETLDYILSCLRYDTRFENVTKMAAKPTLKNVS